MGSLMFPLQGRALVCSHHMVMARHLACSLTPNTCVLVPATKAHTWRALHCAELFGAVLCCDLT